MTTGPDVALGGRYRLTDRIAVGGMGEVWRARDDLLGRLVAVKILKPEYVDAPSFLDRFRAEARHTAALSHAGIANVFDYGEVTEPGPGGRADASGATTAYLVMELVAGEPLSALLARHGRLPPARTMDIVGQVALALQAAHDAGVIHRDVKPGNILVRPDGVVKVTDFGIARAAMEVPLTQTGTVMGTAHYLSPEQGAGRTVTAATDVYSLGVVAYECLAGRRPFVGDNPVTVALAHQREEPPPLPPDIPPPVRGLVAQMLAKDPAARPGSAAEVARAAFARRDAIDAISAGGADEPATTQVYPPVAAPTMVTDPMWPPPLAAGPATVLPVPASGDGGRSGRRWLPWVLLLLGLLALGAVVGTLALRGGSAQVTVPDVAGQSEAAARSQLTALGLTVTTTSVDGAGQPTGTVVGTAPPAGSRVAKGSQVALQLGSNRVSVNPADYLGQPYDQVRARLVAQGFAVQRTFVNGSGTAGTVADVNPSGAVVKGSTLTVSVYATRTSSPTPSASASPPASATPTASPTPPASPSASASPSPLPSDATASPTASRSAVGLSGATPVPASPQPSGAGDLG